MKKRGEAEPTDIFDLIGPIMVGPSSSHTAGAARIGYVARQLLGEEPARALLWLHGSFAATGSGHGTDRALVAGIMGMRPDDRRIPMSFELAAEKGLDFEFFSEDMPFAHPNTVRLELTGRSGARLRVTAASVGGGRIEVRSLGDMELRFSADKPTLIVQNEDRPGSVAEVSGLLAGLGINIATFHVNRDARGGRAIMVIECDAPISGDTVQRIGAIPGILKAVCINPD